ncbi:MAG TPA: SRPBCC domain-containing protein [Marmoricola sp.]|jgi:uncharacterized protein YndB with AHSA1/START domain|nr:SRPBCC domain-containing protein [Marmoricola sp.]
MSAVQHAETTITAPDGQAWFEIIREFDAPPARVFAAHVNPALVARWLGPADLEFHIDVWDAQTGGSWAYSSGRGDDVFEFYGSFHEIRDGERIVQTFTWRGAPDAVALGIATFEALPDGRTRLVNRSVGASAEERDAHLAGGMEAGVVEGYAKLDDLLVD